MYDKTTSFLNGCDFSIAMFDLELEKVIAQIKERDAKRVILQLPDGLKSRAHELVASIEKETGAVAFIWFSSCFGQCDYPLGLGPLGIDIMIQFGHNKYHKTVENW